MTASEFTNLLFDSVWEIFGTSIQIFEYEITILMITIAPVILWLMMTLLLGIATRRDD